MPTSPRHRPNGLQAGLARYLCTILGWAVLYLALLAPRPATALVNFDFETPYLVQPGRQVWDFCLVRQADLYHAFYHTIDQQMALPSYADTIWHAVTPDLKHWDIQGPALISGPGWYDDVAMWAPDVVYDDMSARWAMLYTGVGDGMVQRACLAWSDDLATWAKSPANPVFEPDSLTYHWAPTQTWSSFRDPFVFHDGQQWNMLSTAALRLGVYPGYRRAIVHRAVSTDLETWTDGGVFFEHDGLTGRTYDFESVQYLVREGWHHLFFVEQDPNISNHPTSHMVANDPAAWTMAERTYVDAGWAPEIKRFDAEASADIFARLAKDLDPRDDTWFVTIRFDSVRFNDDGHTPEIFMDDGQSFDWPVREWSAGPVAPTFGDNPTLRDDPARRPEGHGWFCSGENYAGPLRTIGWPGAVMSDTVTSRFESRPFTVTGRSLRLLLAGGLYPETCYVALLDTATAEILTSIHPTGETVLTERSWDIRAFMGRTVRLAIVDDETGPDGWLAVDGIEERMETASPVRDDQPSPLTSAAHLQVSPNPFNGGTEIRFQMGRTGSLRLEIFDLRGRRVWGSPPLAAVGNEISLTWDARDQAGRSLPSGTYVCRALLDGIPAAVTRLTLVE